MAAPIFRSATPAELLRLVGSIEAEAIQAAPTTRGCFVLTLANFPAVLAWARWALIEDDGQWVARVLVGFSSPAHQETYFASMLARLRAEMAERRVSTLRWMRWLRAEDKLAQQLSLNGFVVTETMLDLALDFWRYAEFLQRWEAKFAGKLRPVAEVQLVPLDRTYLPEVRRVVHREGLFGAESLDAVLAGQSGTDHLDPGISTIALRRSGALAGLVITVRRPQANEIHVPARWIEPKLRGTSVYPQMTLRSVYAITASSPPPGIRLRFEANERRHPETVHFARRRGGQVIGAWTQWDRPVN